MACLAERWCRCTTINGARKPTFDSGWSGSENAEFIALYNGEKQEQKRVQGLFGALFDNYTRLIRWQFGLNFFQYTHTLLMALLPSIVIAPRVLSGELEVGRIVQATGAFSAIMGSLTILVDNMESLAGFAAGI